MKRILLLFFLLVISISESKADTAHTLGALQNFVKGIAYVGTFFSWVLLTETLSKKKGKYIVFNFILLIISGLIGIEAINSGNRMSGYNDYTEEANSYITWGWVIIILNILPIIFSIAILLKNSSSKNSPPLNGNMDNEKQEG